MRSLFAIELQFRRGADAEALHALICDWFWRGRPAPRRVLATWQASGSRTYSLPSGASLAVTITAGEDGRVWSGESWVPDAPDDSVEIHTAIGLSEHAGLVSANVTIGLRRRGGVLAPVSYRLCAPTVVSELMSRFPVADGELWLSPKPRRVDADGAQAFVDGWLLNPTRQRPVVRVSPTSRGHCVTDPVTLASSLAGLAHVHYCADEPAALAISDLMPRFRCVPGALRVYWPGLRRNDDPARHWLYRSTELRARRPPPISDVLLWRLGAIAAISVRSTDRLHAEREDYERSEGTVGSLVELEAELDSATARITELQELADTPSADSEPPKTVLDAVKQASGESRSLIFAPRAFASAKASPFQHPEAVLDALRGLDELASRHARANGAGSALAVAARELGLDWRSGVSTATTGGRRRRRRHYECDWNGERIELGPHVRLGTGGGADRVARIYLALHGDEDEGRRIIVGHVGRHLQDSTTS